MQSLMKQWVNWLAFVDTGLYILWNWLVTSSACCWLAYSHVTNRFALMWSILQFHAVNSVFVLCTIITMLHLPFYIFKVVGHKGINALILVARVMGGWLTQVWLKLQVKWKFYMKQLSIYKMNDKNGLRMIKTWLMVIMVSIYMKGLCIYNMNNDDGTEMIEI